jgi:hypothetical protein
MKEMNDKDSLSKSLFTFSPMFLTKIATQFLIECHNIFGQGNFSGIY